MKPQGSLPSSQQPVTGLQPESVQLRHIHTPNWMKSTLKQLNLFYNNLRCNQVADHSR
jgi:hypothetical protein